MSVPVPRFAITPPVEPAYASKPIQTVRSTAPMSIAPPLSVISKEPLFPMNVPVPAFATIVPPSRMKRVPAAWMCNSRVAIVPPVFSHVVPRPLPLFGETKPHWLSVVNVSLPPSSMTSSPSPSSATKRQVFAEPFRMQVTSAPPVIVIFPLPFA